MDSTRSDVIRLRKFGSATLGTSVLFWSWAAVNTSAMQKGFDLGIFSFFFVILSSLFIITRKQDKPARKLGRAFILFTHVLVALNYLLGLLFALTIDQKILKIFALYCFVFVFVWAYIAHTGWNLVTEVMMRVEREEQELDDLYDFNRGNRIDQNFVLP
mmetsp:Transcript_22575/g.27856  ORF Transcript_22575/g.27856 Transcript_22575/m.27856 type:complete len:159 (-) Transcript_22575:120-596(-)